MHTTPICYQAPAIASIKTTNDKKEHFINTQMIVSFSPSENENEISYTGLGYTVRYRKGLDENGNETEFVSGAEFWMFGKIILWGWIA